MQTRAQYRLAGLALAILAWAVVLLPFGLQLNGVDVDLALAAVAGAIIAVAVIGYPLARLARFAWRAARRHPDVAIGVAMLGASAFPALALAHAMPHASEIYLGAAMALPALRPGAGKGGAKSRHATPASVVWDPARWPNFAAAELACKCPTDDADGCAGEYFHDPAFLDALQRLRDLVGKPLKITSGKRCARRNKRVGGASASQHMVAIAADLALAGHDPVDLARKAVAAGFTGIGFGATFLHVDMRPKREGFHYPNAQADWTRRFGFDPAAKFDATGKL